MKVPFFDKRILHQFYRVLSAISVLTSIVFLFVDIDARYKLGIGIAVLALLVALYIGMWIFANKRRVITLKINTSEVEVKFGDIFEEQADLKAIGFNEYFDTQVDNNIISATSLHGQYIEKFYKDKVSELDSMISADTHLPDAYIGENSGRIQEKKRKIQTRYYLCCK